MQYIKICVSFLIVQMFFFMPKEGKKNPDFSFHDLCMKELWTSSYFLKCLWGALVLDVPFLIVLTARLSSIFGFDNCVFNMHQILDFFNRLFL